MPQKYHINSNGDAKPCSAQKRTCRFGEHFSTEKEAQEYVEKQALSENKTNQPSLSKKNSPKEYWGTPMGEFSLESQKSEVFNKLGVVEFIDVKEDSVTLSSMQGGKISLEFEGDCCSHAYVDDVENLKPVESKIKDIRSEHLEDDEPNSYTIRRNTQWTIQYENGEVQTFSEHNLSNGYYGNITHTQTNVL